MSDKDLILLWSDGHRRVVTGADLLGFMLRGIAKTTIDPPTAPDAYCVGPGIGFVLPDGLSLVYRRLRG